MSRTGGRSSGISYQALEPALIGWVHTCIPWTVMLAFERFNRPLSIAEKDRYLAEQAVIGRMGGAVDIPESVAELDLARGHRARAELVLEAAESETVNVSLSDGAIRTESSGSVIK